MTTPYRAPSKGAARVYEALKLLGDYTIIPEYHIGDRLRLDFYIPELKYGIEVQGTQHDQRNYHFQQDQEAFEAQKARDKEKALKCKGLGITYVPLPYKAIMRAKSAEELLDDVLLAEVAHRIRKIDVSAWDEEDSD